MAGMDTQLERLGCDSDASNSSWEDMLDEEDDETLKEDGNGRRQSQSLLMNSLILERIFEFLPVKDLQLCRLVCKEWNKTALLRKLIGTKVKIRITKSNFDKLLRIAQNSSQPFCRIFEFQLVELDFDKVSKFMKYFGERISSLSIKFCTASSTESVMKVLNCPRLEELTIFGALPEILEENFHSYIFTRLSVLSLNSSLDYGQVSQRCIKILLQHATNLQTVKIGSSIFLWKEFSSALSNTTSPKLCQIEFSGIEVPFEIDFFQCFFSKRLALRKISFQSCLVSQEFLEQFLTKTFRNLNDLEIEGTQQEILSKAFSVVTLPNIKVLSLPIDGISSSEGAYILNSCPNLGSLKVTGLFQTVFTFKGGRLSIISLNETFCSVLPSITYEKQRELLKVLSLINLQPDTLDVNLPNSNVNSRCMRAIYKTYPDLKDLRVVFTSLKECIVGLTGIPYRIYRKIAYCKSFSVISSGQFSVLPSISKLTKLKRLEMTIFDDAPNAELTLLLFVFGISEVSKLKELILDNFMATDVSFMTLAQKLRLSVCKINGSDKEWKQFQSFYKHNKIKNFLLPPPVKSGNDDLQSIGMNSKFLVKVFGYMSRADVFEARKVCRHWHVLVSDYLHRKCENESLTEMLENRLHHYGTDQTDPSSPRRTLNDLRQRHMPNLVKVLETWSSLTHETTLAIIQLDKSTLERLQLDNSHIFAMNRTMACQNRKMLEYWYYPSGADELVYQAKYRQRMSAGGKCKSLDESSDFNTLLTIGYWGRKDDGLLEFLNPSWTISTIYLIGLQKEALDIVLPKLTQMVNLESLYIKPLINTTSYCELTKTHLQILCNAAFNLKTLSMQLHAPSEAVVEFVRSQQFTLEILELQSIVNISDRLTFSMPQLKVLQLDEPPGSLLWTTLNIHSTLQTISFGRNGGSSNQVKNKYSKMEPLESDFEHSATEVICDINWFLENSITKNRSGIQKSILQQGSDSALTFFTHFPFLSSLTLRGVHAHYGLLQGVFRKFPQLKKLELINASGVTDEILTGYSKEVLDEMDIMNPFQSMRGGAGCRTEVKKKGRSVSIRNLKSLTHLIVDDQPGCTDFSVLFGILKLQQLQILSCKKWKITDIAVRAMGDVVPSLKEIDTTGCATVSKYALEYFKESRRVQRVGFL